MTPKFKVGAHVRITWRPENKQMYPQKFLEALKEEQIISKIETNKGFKPGYYYSYYFEEPGHSRLSCLNFYEEEMELVSSQPVFNKKTELPEI